MSKSRESAMQEEGLKRILSFISEDSVRSGARWIAYFSAVATVYLIAGGDIRAIAVVSPVLARLIESIGPNTLATILDRIGRGNEEADSVEDILNLIEDSLADVDLTAGLTEREFYRAMRLLQQRDAARFQEFSHYFLSILTALQSLHPGDPAPLSLIPKTTRQRPTNEPLIGRDTDLSWLRQTSGDRLLIGQPGIGKTSLLFQLAVQENGRFAVTQDRGEIGAALIEEKPAIVIVDDAHRVPDLLADIRHLRQKKGLEFDIVASTWPSSKEIVADNLALGLSKQHELALLTRDEMVEVIKGAGVLGPDPLIREIVDQAVGRPGLAHTLSLLCLDDDVQDIFSGQALRRSVIRVLSELGLPREARLILATLSFAGDAGMALEDVAQLLGLRTPDVWGILDSLSGSGIIYDTAQNRISVRPAALRETLVVDVFFENASPVTPAHLIAQMPDLITPVVLTLIGARARGGAVPEHLLVEVLKAGASMDAWTQYAWLGRSEAKWVLVNHPALITSVAYPVLYHAPELAVPMLLERAIGDDRPLNANSDHPLRVIEEWIRSARPGSGETVVRRRKLLRATLAWLDSGKDKNVGLRTLPYLMSPGFQFTRSDPGSGTRIVLHSGIWSADELREIKKIWIEIIPVLNTLQGQEWKPIKNLIEDWASPGRTVGGQSLSEEGYDQMVAFAAQMITDVAPVAGDQPGLKHWLLELANRLGVKLEIDLASEFQVLYPHMERHDWREAERVQREEAHALAIKWSSDDPRWVVEQVAAIEAEARASNLRHPRWTGYVFRVIADEVEIAAPWLDALATVDGTWDMLFPFLRKAAYSNERGWPEKALAFLDRPDYRIASVQLALGMEAPPQELLDLTLEYAPDFYQTVETMCLRGEVPETTLTHLLQHKDEKVARAVAWGEWNADPRREVRQAVESEWHDVVLDCIENNHWLREILRHRKAIALAWLRNVLSSDFYLYRLQETVQVAIDSISIDERKEILASLDPRQVDSGRLAARLVGDDLDAYRTLLLSDKPRSLHLAPLASEMDDMWHSKVRIALDAGYTPDEIVGAVFPSSFTWSGKLSDMWQDWVDEFEKLCKDEDDRIQQIGAIGRRKATERREKALERERDEDVFGWQ